MQGNTLNGKVENKRRNARNFPPRQMLHNFLQISPFIGTYSVTLDFFQNYFIKRAYYSLTPTIELVVISFFVKM